MRRIFCFVLLSLAFLMSTYAQIQGVRARRGGTYSAVVKNYTDSLRFIAEKLKNDSSDLNPYYYRILGPSTYFSNATAHVLSIDWRPANAPKENSDSLMSGGMLYRDELNRTIDRALVNVYTYNPKLVKHCDSQYKDESIIEMTPVDDQRKKKDDLKTIIDKVPELKDVSELTGDIDVDIHVMRPNFWKTSGNSSLQFTQNYFTKNWYKGGNNNGTMVFYLNLQANYNDQRYIQWDNRLEMKLGFVTTTSDTCHTFLTNNDMLKLASKLGVKARTSWYYTLSTEAVTQFMPGYKSNDKKRYSQFLAPLDVYVSIGMDYKPSLKNGASLSVALLPLSYKLRYIGVDNENVHNNYGMADKDAQNDFGSRVEVNYNMTIVKNVSWRSKLYYYSTYKYVEAEFENTIDFKFSQYISSQFYMRWRFDDSRSRDYYDKKLGFFQMMEYLTLGLNYSF